MAFGPRAFSKVGHEQCKHPTPEPEAIEARALAPTLQNSQGLETPSSATKGRL